MFVTVTSKGQLTVPKAIRKKYGIQAGSRLLFEPHEDGSLRVRIMYRGSENLAGILHRPGMKACTIEEMNEGITRALSEKLARSRT